MRGSSGVRTAATSLVPSAGIHASQAIASHLSRIGGGFPPLVCKKRPQNRENHGCDAEKGVFSRGIRLSRPASARQFEGPTATQGRAAPCRERDRVSSGLSTRTCAWPPP